MKYTSFLWLTALLAFDCASGGSLALDPSDLDNSTNNTKRTPKAVSFKFQKINNNPLNLPRRLRNRKRGTVQQRLDNEVYFHCFKLQRMRLMAHGSAGLPVLRRCCFGNATAGSETAVCSRLSLSLFIECQLMTPLLQPRYRFFGHLGRKCQFESLHAIRPTMPNHWNIR
jgi:hypothetical protein